MSHVYIDGSSISHGPPLFWIALQLLFASGMQLRLWHGCKNASAFPAGPLFSQLSALRSFLRELKPQLGSISSVLAAVDELAELGRLLQAWGLAPEQIMLEPLLTPQAEHFGGTLFQVRWYKHRLWLAGWHCGTLGCCYEQQDQ